MVDALDVEQVVREVSATSRKKLPAEDPAVRPQVEELKDRPVHDYVSVLAQRAAKKRLTAT